MSKIATVWNMGQVFVSSNQRRDALPSCNFGHQKLKIVNFYIRHRADARASTKGGATFFQMTALLSHIVWSALAGNILTNSIENI
jgi:hypothetical protein